MASEYRAPLTFRGGGINAERRLRVPWAFGGTSYNDLETILDEIIFEQQRYGTAATAQAAQATSASGAQTFSGSAATDQTAQTTEASGSITVAAPAVTTSGSRKSRYAPRAVPAISMVPRRERLFGYAELAQEWQRIVATGRVPVLGGAVTLNAQQLSAKGATSTDRRDERDLLEIIELLRLADAA